MELKELFDRYQLAMNSVYRSVNNISKENVHSDITTDQFSTLQYIYNYERCTSTQIATAFGVGKSAVSAQVNRLVEQDLIERIRDQRDRRNVYLYVTKKGVALINHTEKELYAVIGKQLAHFEEEEITVFIHSLEKLAKIMSEQSLN